MLRKGVKDSIVVEIVSGHEWRVSSKSLLELSKSEYQLPRISRDERVRRKGSSLQIRRTTYETPFARFVERYKKVRKANKGRSLTVSQVQELFKKLLNVSMSYEQVRKYLHEALERGQIRDTLSYYEVE